MSPKHTPGPWTFDGNFFQVFANDGGNAVASVYSTTAPEPMASEARANARLISAAPDLLGALIGMVNKYGDKSQFPTCDASVSARAAISKAEGNK